MCVKYSPVLYKNIYLLLVKIIAIMVNKSFDDFMVTLLITLNFVFISFTITRFFFFFFFFFFMLFLIAQ